MMVILPKGKISLLGVLLCCLPSFVQAGPLTLQDCIARGLQNNPQVEAYRLAVDESQEGIYQAWGEFLPTISAEYAHNRLENNLDTALDEDYLSHDSDSFTIGVSQPLFDGLSSVSGLSLARQAREASEYELAFRKLQLVRDIRTSFFDLLRARQLIEKWRESIDRLESQKRIAKAWVEQELATRLRLLEVEVEQANAQQNLVSAQAARSIAEARLAEFLGIPQEAKVIEVSGDLQTTIAIDCQKVEQCLDHGLSRRPDLRAAELNVSMARAESKRVRARNLPRVSLDARWVDFQREFDSDELVEEERDYYTLGINVSIRPFQGGRNIFAYRRQKLAVKRFEMERINRENLVVSEVRGRYQQMLEAEGRVTSAQKSVDEAREAYAFVTRSVKLEVSSLDDLLAAELRLTRAEISKIEAEHALQLSRTNLDYAVAGNVVPSLASP